MEVDSRLKVLLVAEAADGVLHPLDLGVDGFAGCVSDAKAQVRDDVLKATLQQTRYLHQRKCFRADRS